MRKSLPLLLAILLGVAGAGVSSTAQASTPTTPESAPSSAPAPRAERHTTQAEATAPASDAARYAAREKQSGSQQDFRGGGASLYIGGSALTVALIIVLAIIIL